MQKRYATQSLHGLCDMFSLQAIVDMLVDVVVSNAHFFTCLQLVVQFSNLPTVKLKQAVANIVTIMTMPLPQRSHQTLLHVAASQGR